MKSNQYIKLNSLSFTQGIKMMKVICEENVDGQQQSFWVFRNIEVCYPGKKNQGDYLLKISGEVLKHSDICKIVATYVLNGILGYEDMIDLLENIYNDGLQCAETDSEQIKYLKCILYWTTLQEEINYPQSDGYEGRRMSFKRYAEAILATRSDSKVTLDDVMRRADNWKLASDVFEFPNKKPSFYY